MTEEYIVRVLENDECITEGELIRCRECKYWMADYNHICTAASGYTIKSGDGFCDWAERKEE